MASAFVIETFEKLRKQVESLGFDEKQKNKFLEEWKRLCGAEKRRAIREAEERKAVLVVEAKEAQRKRDMEAEEAHRVREFELEKLKSETDAKRLAVERQVEKRHINRRPVGGKVRLPELPFFTDGKDDLDSYLLRFERYAARRTHGNQEDGRSNSVKLLLARYASRLASYCRSCDICQRTVAKGGVTRVPLGKMPLIDMPFKRVAIDLIGAIILASDKGHRYILTL